MMNVTFDSDDRESTITRRTFDLKELPRPGDVVTLSGKTYEVIWLNWEPVQDRVVVWVTKHSHENKCCQKHHTHIDPHKWCPLDGTERRIKAVGA